MHDQTPAAAAAQEAFEEGGLSGKASDTCLGVYSYTKPLKFGDTAILAMVYPLHVTKVHSKWPEKKERRRKWFSQKKASKKLTEPELKRIVATFAPHKLPK